MQAKLLRVLQTGVFERVGGTESIKVDVRIIAATHKRLEDEVEGGPVPQGSVLPAQRDPPGAAAAARAQGRHSAAGHPLPRAVSVPTRRPPSPRSIADAMQALLQHDWPGNVRELENAIKSAIAFADGSIIRRANLPETLSPRLPQKLAAVRSSTSSGGFPSSPRTSSARSSASTSCASSPSTTAMSRSAPVTAASRGGASPRRFSDTVSSESSSSADRQPEKSPARQRQVKLRPPHFAIVIGSSAGGSRSRCRLRPFRFAIGLTRLPPSHRCAPCRVWLGSPTEESSHFNAECVCPVLVCPTLSGPS